MKESHVTIADLVREEDLSYQRMSRAVGCLRRAGLITPQRGDNNEIQLSEKEAMLIRSLAELIRRDFGVQRGADFLTKQIWRKQLQLYASRIQGLVQKHPECRNALEEAGLLEESMSLSPEQLDALVQRAFELA